MYLLIVAFHAIIYFVMFISLLFQPYSPLWDCLMQMVKPDLMNLKIIKTHTVNLPTRKLHRTKRTEEKNDMSVFWEVSLMECLTNIDVKSMCDLHWIFFYGHDWYSCQTEHLISSLKLRTGKAMLIVYWNCQVHLVHTCMIVIHLQWSCQDVSKPLPKISLPSYQDSIKILNRLIFAWCLKDLDKTQGRCMDDLTGSCLRSC